MSSTPNPPAVPTPSTTNEIDPDGAERYAQKHYPIPGMSLRDWFAGLVLPEAIRQAASEASHPTAVMMRGGTIPSPKAIIMGAAIFAYEVADAMLEARGEK